jgi:hypothetical protein
MLRHRVHAVRLVDDSACVARVALLQRRRAGMAWLLLLLLARGVSGKSSVGVKRVTPGGRNAGVVRNLKRNISQQ